MTEVDAVRLRREVRRSTARFLRQELSHAELLREVERSATACGIAIARVRGGAERALDALAWGGGTVEPGLLPLRLEPVFERFTTGQIDLDTFAAEVRRTIAQVRRPGPGGNGAR
jgi:hypothetical protein